MNILIVGGGGREHAMAWKVAQSPLVDEIFIAPGNAGTAAIGTNVMLNDDDETIAFAQANRVGLTLVGPEVPLANGIVDRFRAADLPIFGPTEKAAQLEASKAFSKAFMARHGIETAAYGAFTDCDSALAYLDAQPDGGIVVKASGLAAGKGVIICDNLDEARTAVREIMLDGQFGVAGAEVVIEERMSGAEVSLLAFCDGKTAVPMVPARDHKRAFDHDEGLNTGGMGAFAPVPEITVEWIAHITETVLQRAVDGMAAEGTPYVGVLYAGLMLTPAGVRVLEFNCRFGDPETQVILPLLESDLVQIALDCIGGTLSKDAVKIRAGAAATIVIASPGYPQSYPKGLSITGVDTADAMPNTVVFHAGTAVKNGQLVTNGGRVLAVSAVGADLDASLTKAYASVAQIQFDGAHFRSDIGRTGLV